MQYLALVICVIVIALVGLLIAFLKIIEFEYISLHKINTNENVEHGRFEDIKSHIKKSAIKYCNSKGTINRVIFDEEIKKIFDDISRKTANAVKQSVDSANREYRRTFEYSILYAIAELHRSKIIEELKNNKYVSSTYNKIKSRYPYKHPFESYRTILEYVRTLYQIEFDLVMMTVYIDGDIKNNDTISDIEEVCEVKKAIPNDDEDILIEIDELRDRINKNVKVIANIELKEIVDSIDDVPNFKIYSKSSLDLLKDIDIYEKG